MIENRQSQIISGLCALALGLILTLSTGSSPVLKTMGFLAWVLEIPEKPALTLRIVYERSLCWIRERREILSRLDKLEDENDTLFLALHMKDALLLRESVINSSVNSIVDLRLPLSWWDQLRINKGGLDGVSPGDPVLQDGFFVGKISSVSSSRSWVSLITSMGEMIPVVVRETRDVGVVVGDGHGGLWLKYVPDDGQISEGMTLDTALIGESIPPGIPVGTISAETREGDQGVLEYGVLSGGALSRIYGVRVFRQAGDAK